MSWLDAVLALFKPKQQGGGYQPLPSPDPLPPRPAPVRQAIPALLTPKAQTMTPQNEIVLVDELRRDEGVRYSPYIDSKGISTVGVGHNLQAKPLRTDWFYPLTDSQVDQLLESDLDSVYADLDRNLSWWRALDDVRQRALVNFVFNLGITKALGFKKSLPLIQQGKYDEAADNMLQSDWAKQVPNRAKRVTEMIRTGSV